MLGCSYSSRRGQLAIVLVLAACSSDAVTGGGSASRGATRGSSDAGSPSWDVGTNAGSRGASGTGTGGPLEPLAPTKPVGDWVRFAVIGDFGGANLAEADVADLVHSWDLDFIVTVGDNNYPSGSALTIDNNVGQFFADFIGDYTGEFGPGSSSNRFWPSPGNHDWGNSLAPYINYFTLPGNERYYDVQLGPLHLFSLDSDSREPDGTSEISVQANWLSKKMSQSTSCHRLVVFHHAAYSSATHGSYVLMQWPFEQWGATAVIGGHDHVYERLKVGGIRYFVNGLGGRSIYNFPSVLENSEYRYKAEYGAMLITADEQEIVYEFINVAGEIMDRYIEPASCR